MWFHFVAEEIILVDYRSNPTHYLIVKETYPYVATETPHHSVVPNANASGNDRPACANVPLVRQLQPQSSTETSQWSQGSLRDRRSQ